MREMMINHIDQWITEISSDAPIILYIYMYGVNITNIHTYLLGLLLQISHDKSICFKEEAAQK